MEGDSGKRRLPLVPWNRHRPLSAFDIVGFSLQYELSYTNVLMMLELGGIPSHRGDREEKHPLVIAGGPSAFNPAPMIPFIDAFVIGEGEEVVAEIAASLMTVRDQGGKRRERLEALAGINGVYVPASIRTARRNRKTDRHRSRCLACSPLSGRPPDEDDP